jgi:hypothetical protein
MSALPQEESGAPSVAAPQVISTWLVVLLALVNIVQLETGDRKQMINAATGRTSVVSSPTKWALFGAQFKTFATRYHVLTLHQQNICNHVLILPKDGENPLYRRKPALLTEGMQLFARRPERYVPQSNTKRN